MINLKDFLKARKGKNIKIYLCGPTLYDDIHIGNIAPVIVFDFLIRYLRERNINYTYIHNLTDIDDKIIAKAQKLNKEELKISESYKTKYLEILHKLQIIFPTIMPMVSTHIKEIQEVIKKLENKKITQIQDNDVLFDISKCSNYGSISNQDINSIKNFSNFCLWKHTTQGLKWESPWGLGRPGWHTECFTFIEKYADGWVDIHGGGVDLKFPHHENENAHCQALYNKNLAHLWLHIGHISDEEGKISKSLNNSQKYLVKNLIKSYSPNTIRFLFLLNKYSLPSKIDNNKLNLAHEEWSSLNAILNKAKSWLIIKKQKIENIKIQESFLQIIENDLNMPEVLSWLLQIKKKLNKAIKDKHINEIKSHYQTLYTHIKWLGFQINEIHTNENIQLLKIWNNYLNNKEYTKADEIRKILIAKQLI